MPDGRTSPATSTNSFLLLTTTQTGTASSRALISSGLNASSSRGWARRRTAAAAPPMCALTDCVVVAAAGGGGGGAWARAPRRQAGRAPTILHGLTSKVVAAPTPHRKQGRQAGRLLPHVRALAQGGRLGGHILHAALQIGLQGGQVAPQVLSHALHGCGAACRAAVRVQGARSCRQCSADGPMEAACRHAWSAFAICLSRQCAAS